MELLSGLLGLTEAGARIAHAFTNRGAPLYEEAFIRGYSEYLRNAIDLVTELDDLKPQELRDSAQSVLNLMALIVKGYHGKSKDDLVVNANYMIPNDPTKALLSRAMLVHKDRQPEAFLCFLELIMWAEKSDACPGDVVLPVEKPDSTTTMLFGAPKAFVSKSVQIVADTTEVWQEVQDHENQDVREEASKFFKKQHDRFRSFASFPVLAPANMGASFPHPVIAVVNVDSSRPHVLGKPLVNRTKMRYVLEPVIHVLSHFLCRLHYPQVSRTNPASPTSTTSGGPS